jgi:hypothetical protein
MIVQPNTGNKLPVPPVPPVRFAAQSHFLSEIRGLTPTATCGHRFAIPEWRNFKRRKRGLNLENPSLALRASKPDEELLK